MSKRLVLCLVVLLAPVLAGAETVTQRNGTDLFVAGSSGLPAVDTQGDVFAAGQSVVLQGKAGGDAHAAGFDVSVEAPVAGNLYAAGASVTVLAPVSQDLTVMGMNLRTSALGSVAGNARMLGGTVVVDGPVTGALTVTAGEVTLNSVVSGDVLLVSDAIRFGPSARILGRLTYSASEPMMVPTGVISADRVSYRKLTVPETVTDFGERWGEGQPTMPSGRVVAGGLALLLGFLVAVGAVTLALAPAWSDRIRRTAEARPGAALLAGVFGLAALFGLVPVAILTLIGIPLLPLVLAAILLGWMMSYLFGVYAMSLRLAHAFGLGEGAGLLPRVLVLALGLLVAAILNFVPILGWMINFCLLLAGAGAIVLVSLRSPVAAPAAVP